MMTDEWHGPQYSVDYCFASAERPISDVCWATSKKAKKNLMSQECNAEFDRSAVVTIQGGAIYGLTMLGQLSELVSQRKIVPAALAANSAGAIIATLFWAGYKPLAIRDLFIGLAAKEDLILLLGSAGANKCRIERAYKRMTKLFSAMNRRTKSRRERTWPEWAQVWTTDAAALYFHGRRALNYYRHRGIFDGAELEAQLDRWIRESPLLEQYARSIRPPSEGLLRFADVRRLSSECGVYFPPLLLTATNVASRKLVVFNSFENKFDDVRIASAVRASAGFPGFFKPVEVAGAPEPGPYVDGGMITNYPAWIFNFELREKLAATDQYRTLAARPWLHIGLRVIWEGTPADRPDPTPRAFAAGMKDLFLGGARTQLEDRISPVKHSVVIAQPSTTTAGPKNILDVKAVTPDVIREMVMKGEQFAAAELDQISFTLPPHGEIEQILRDLIAAVAFFLRDADSLKLRSNVFLAWRDRLVLQYAVNMEGDPDEKMNFHFTEGLTGFAYMRRCPHLCNLKKIRELVNTGEIDASRLFGMSPEQQSQVRPDRTLLANVPILDPAAITVRDLGGPPGKRPVEYQGVHYEQAANPVDGAIFGVLNLDSAAEFTQIELRPEPIYWTDVKVNGMIDLMHAASWRIGRKLADAFGAKGEMTDA